MLNLTYNYGNKHDCSFGIPGMETMHFHPNMKTWEQGFHASNKRMEYFTLGSVSSLNNL